MRGGFVADATAWSVASAALMAGPIRGDIAPRQAGDTRVRVAALQSRRYLLSSINTDIEVHRGGCCFKTRVPPSPQARRAAGAPALAETACSTAGSACSPSVSKPRRYKQQRLPSVQHQHQQQQQKQQQPSLQAHDGVGDACVTATHGTLAALSAAHATGPLAGVTLTRYDASVLREIVATARTAMAADYAAGAAGTPVVGLGALLRAYEHVLPQHGVLPAEDTRYYAALLQLALDPCPDWDSKLDELLLVAHGTVAQQQPFTAPCSPGRPAGHVAHAACVMAQQSVNQLRQQQQRTSSEECWRSAGVRGELRAPPSSELGGCERSSTLRRPSSTSLPQVVAHSNGGCRQLAHASTIACGLPAAEAAAAALEAAAAAVAAALAATMDGDDFPAVGAAAAAENNDIDLDADATARVLSALQLGANAQQQLKAAMSSQANSQPEPAAPQPFINAGSGAFPCPTVVDSGTPAGCIFPEQEQQRSWPSCRSEDYSPLLRAAEEGTPHAHRRVGRDSPACSGRDNAPSTGMPSPPRARSLSPRVVGALWSSQYTSGSSGGGGGKGCGFSGGAATRSTGSSCWRRSRSASPTAAAAAAAAAGGKEQQQTTRLVRASCSPSPTGRSPSSKGHVRSSLLQPGFLPPPALRLQCLTATPAGGFGMGVTANPTAVSPAAATLSPAGPSSRPESPWCGATVRACLSDMALAGYQRFARRMAHQHSWPASLSAAIAARCGEVCCDDECVNGAAPREKRGAVERRCAHGVTLHVCHVTCFT